MTEKVGLANLTPSLKSFLLILSIVGVVTPAVLGFVNFDYRLDGVEVAQREDREKGLKRDEKIVNLEKREIERRGEYSMIRSDLERFEATLSTIVSELKRLERGE